MKPVACSSHERIREPTTAEGITLEQMPTNRKVIASGWVYKTKTDRDEVIVRYKARFAAKRFSQVRRVYFGDTYAPVAQASTLWAVLALAANRGYEIYQLDAKTAFSRPTSRKFSTLSNRKASSCTAEAASNKFAVYTKLCTASVHLPERGMEQSISSRSVCT